MPASDDQPPSPPKRRVLKPNRIILLLILAAAVGIFFHLNQGARTTVVVQAPPTPTTLWPGVSPPVMETPTPPAPSPEQPVIVPTTPAASYTSTASPSGTAVPATAEDVAALLGGSPDQWSKGPDEWGRTVDANGWIYRSPDNLQLHFAVPAGCQVDVGTRHLFGGAQIDAANFTIYWGDDHG